MKGLVDELLTDEAKFKNSWAKQAKRQVAFVNGDQRVDAASGASPIMVNSQPANNVEEHRQNMYQTNEIEPVVRTLVAYMCRQKPAVETFPNDYKSEEQKNTAKIAEMVHEAKYELDHEYTNSRMAAWWALSVGNIYVKDFWNPDKGMFIEGSTQRTGDTDVSILTPLSVSIDHSCTDFEKQPFIIESYMMDIDWIKSAFNRDEPGYTGKAENVRGDSYARDALSTLEDLKYALPYIGSQTGANVRNKAIVREMYFRPNNEWAKGRLLIRAGEEWVYSSPQETGSPYYMPYEEEMWHPYTFFGYEPYLGRALYKSVVEQILPLQMRINEINGAILENANTLAKPNVLTPENCLKKGILNGKGANVYTYRVIPGAQPPSVMMGTPLPQQFFDERQQLIDAIVRIIGTNFAMSGAAPPGVTAASAIQTLLENASSQQSDLMLSWEKFHEARYNKKLRIIHKFMQYPNPKLDKYIKMMNKDLLQKEVQDFVGQRDLASGFGIKVQYASMIAKSESAKRDLYQNLAKEGLLGPISDPGPQGAKLRDQMLERLGEEPFDTDESTDIKKAKWENDRIKSGMPVEISPYDNDALHITVHVGDLQDPVFLEKAEDKVKLDLDNHVKAHQAAQQQKSPPPPPPPPPRASLSVNIKGESLPPEALQILLTKEGLMPPMPMMAPPPQAPKPPAPKSPEAPAGNVPVPNGAQGVAPVPALKGIQ